MMKKKIVLPLVMMFVGMASLFAQEGKAQGEKGKKGKEMKVAYITEELKLTDSESEKFWPVYDNHAKQKRAIKKSIKALKSSINENEKISEAEFRQATDDISDLKIKEISLNKEYINSIVPILGVERTIQLVKAEKDFRKKLHEKRQEKRLEKK